MIGSYTFTGFGSSFTTGRTYFSYTFSATFGFGFGFYFYFATGFCFYCFLG
jgi:hypothetical protein